MSEIHTKSFHAEYNFAQFLRRLAGMQPDLATKYPKTFAYLNAWMTGPLPVTVREGAPIVHKTDVDNYIVYVKGTEPYGYLLAKEAKKEEWNKQFPGQSEKVWVVPEGDQKVLRPMNQLRDLLTFMETKAPTPKEEIVQQMTDTIVTHLEQMPVEERQERVAAFAEAVSPETPISANAEMPISSETLPPLDSIAAEIMGAEGTRQLNLVETEPVAEPEKKPKKRVKKHTVGEQDLVVKVKKEKKPKAPKVKPDRSLRTVFKEHLKTINIENIKKPWMATKAFRLIETEADLQAWADQVIADKTRWRLDVKGTLCPIVAVDAETTGLDNRVIIHINEQGEVVYDIKAEIAGLCLSSDGLEGIYLPVNHEIGKCVPREAVRRILQRLFDVCHLVFYNAKFDREILRLCLGIQTRPFPHFEDVQVLNYDNDPKAQLDEESDSKAFTDAGGLKALSHKILEMEQIELETLIRVKAQYTDTTICKCKHPSLQHPDGGHCTECSCEKFTGKESLRLLHAPFNWLPTDIALWYAGGDAICTWLLWEKAIHPARDRRNIHSIDHDLVDTITWIERQRFNVDIERHNKTVKWHQTKLRAMEEDMRKLANSFGWPEKSDDAGNVNPETMFNVNSNPQVARLLFDIRGWKPTVHTEAGGVSVNAEAMTDQMKLHPDDPFLTLYDKYKDYVSLHPENLRYDPVDHSARVYFKQNVVAGGRLAAAGGKFDKDGGFGLNPQGIKKPTNNWYLNCNVLCPDHIAEDQIEEHPETDLHASCFRGKKKAPNIIKNHIGVIYGYVVCLVPSCTSCKEKFGILIEDTKIDANEVLNLRCLFSARTGWTFFSIDYSNIEMRAAANCSGEPKFIDEFLVGSGDFHSLTAGNVFPEFKTLDKSDPRYKDYRELAKIINFALLYGGTEHTIFENMRKKKPDITKEEAADMVRKYWEGVPIFKQFCDRKQREAREGPAPTNEPKWEDGKGYTKHTIIQHDDAVWVCLGQGPDNKQPVFDEPNDKSDFWIRYMMCRTSIGRIINFVSAMESQGIHKPNRAEVANYKQYRHFRERAKWAGEEKDNAETKEDKLRFATEEADWAAKAQAMWANPETGVRNHIDFQRFVGKIQRVAVNVPLQGIAGDFMRLALNRIRKFAVDTCPQMQSVMRLHATVHDEIDLSIKNEYIPFVIPRLTRLMKLRTLYAQMQWRVPIECDVEYGKSWDVDSGIFKDGYTKVPGLAKYIPNEFAESVKPILKALESGDDARRAKVDGWAKANLHERVTGKDGQWKKVMEGKDHKSILKALIIALQIHEYWMIDTIADKQPELLGSLEQYEADNNLTPANRGLMPVNGFLGAIPLDERITRPTLERLFAEGEMGGVLTAVAPVAVAATVEQASLPLLPQFPTLRNDLSREETLELRNALGKGNRSVRVLYKGQEFDLSGVDSTDIPEQYLVR